MSILRTFAILLLFYINLSACYLCSMTDPTVYTTTKLISDGEKINYIETKWKYSDLYAFNSAQNYDENKDYALDKKELEKVHKDFYVLLEEFKYNTTVYINGKAIDLMGKVFDKDILLTYERLEASFKIKLDQPITPDLNILVDYIDNNGILAYFVSEYGFSHNIPSKFQVTSNIEDFTLPLEISFNQKIHTEKTENAKKKEDSISITLANILTQTSNKISSLIVEIKESKSYTPLFVLLFFAFIYGVVHAAGPGHGKSLVASYMLTHNKDIKKALSIATLIAFVHVFSAFIMTFGIYFILNEFFSKYLDDSQMIITKISGVIIITIALHMLYKKFKVAKENKKFTFSIHNPSCGCSACKLSNKTTDLGVIISAGIIPCPGTVTIFIFALSLKAYVIGFLAALTMSIGMSVIIFVTAALSITIRKSVENSKLSKFLEYFSLIFILALGLFLLFSV